MKLLNLLLPLAQLVNLAIAEVDVFDVEESESLGEARLFSGNTSENPAFVLERSLIGLDNLRKRQSCVSGWGTCPGGVTCGCPLTANCCGTICKAVADTCCRGFICPSGWGCCGDGTCYPYGGDCCSNGRYCDPGEVCIRLNGDACLHYIASIRCSVIGATTSVRATYATISTPTATTARATITSYTPPAITQTQVNYVWYTFDITLYIDIYTITTLYYTFVTSTSAYTEVDYTYTTSITTMSAQATAESVAYRLVYTSADVIQSSLYSSADSYSSSLSSSLRRATSAAATSTSSHRTSSSTSRTTSTASAATASASASASSVSGGGATAGANRLGFGGRTETFWLFTVTLGVFTTGALATLL